MKTFNLFTLILLLCSQVAHAQPPRKSQRLQEPYLQVFVIDPPYPINWTSPKTLLKSTLWNGLTGDPAPNGHLAVYIKTRKPNRHGVTEILTGMGRTNKMKTMWDTIYQEYGLSAMTHEFSGDLDSAEATRKELNFAYRKKRLSSIRVQLTDSSAEKLFEFLENWITYGSFRHYGGNMNVPKGEGSGCADFATHFLSIALNGRIPSEEWDTGVFLPYPLLQEAPGRKKQKVSIPKMLRSDVPWAKSDADGLFISIPDPEKITRWIKKRSPYQKKVVIFPDEVVQLGEVTESFSQPFQAPYPRESQHVIAHKWKSISLSP